MAKHIDDNQNHALEEAMEQFVDSQLWDEEPNVDEFVKRYPEFEHQIKKRIRKIQKIHALFDSLVQADESDFEDAVTGQDLVGEKIGSFEITEVIGRGGMGVVYRARDTRLKRSVAIKSMPAQLKDDPTAKMRFSREAELLASLNHSGIAVIYDIIEQDDGAGYLVLEYVPGQTLAQRIAHKPLKLEEALSIAQQVAEVVSAAHDKGVIHRDLKPSNIKLTPDGRVKVLDFGLAKAVGGEPSKKPATVTQMGRVMGTPAYMSPEQARGKDPDHRTDIWSFGCIMYQMLTGRLPFEGETATDTLAHIIEREPDWEMLPQEIPMNIRTLLRRCLEKKPHRRLRDIGDACIEISETLNIPATAPPVTTPSSILLKPQITARHKLRTAATIVVAAFVILLSVIAVQLVSKKEVQPSLKEIRLVVLPFENLGPTEDEYFAAGITDAITAHLAGIRGLGVISRQSAIQYQKRERDTRQIAKELRVDYILEGTVQHERPTDPTSRVRIIPQLIKASEDTHVWTEIYDDDMSEVFRLQSNVAEQVAQALDITLLGPERQSLASKPTENMEAYEYYLRGNEYMHRSVLENDLRIAIQMYEKALKLDPTFALAYSELSRAHVWIYWLHYDHSEERLAMAKQAADKTLQLNPELPEAHLALGHYYYHGHLDYDRALEHFAIARKSQPNNSDLLSFIGFVQRRQGKFEQALENLKRAAELDPRSKGSLAEAADILTRTREYKEAEQYYERAISLAPDWPMPYPWKAQLYLLWEGSTEKARAVLQKGLQNINSPSLQFYDFLIKLDIYDGHYQKALDLLSLKSQDIDRLRYFIPGAMRYARIYMYMHKKELAKKYFDDARDILESKIEESPENERFHSSLGIAYAGLGRKQEAIREGQLGIELLPMAKDAWGGPFRVEDLARIYVMVGEFDAAIDQLEFLLSKPGELSIPLLRLDPAWNPLREHPRFKKLIESAK